MTESADKRGDNMINIFLKTAPEIDKELAERLAGIRKRRKKVYFSSELYVYRWRQ